MLSHIVSQMLKVTRKDSDSIAYQVSSCKKCVTIHKIGGLG
jgi:hypothetical protein